MLFKLVYIHLSLIMSGYNNAINLNKNAFRSLSL